MRNNKSVIYKSRQGYAYQDKYALLRFLKYFRVGNVTEFYVDFPFGENGYSIDFLVIFEKPIISKQVFEVKTGEKFKNDKQRELKKELNILHEYKSNNLYVDSINLIIDPEIKPNIERNFADLRVIKECNSGTHGGEKYKDKLERCHRNLGNFIETKEEFKSFVKRINFNNEIYSNIRSEHEEYSDLERILFQEVTEISDELKRRGCSEELPYWYTVESLLEVIRQNAGDGKNLLPKLKSRLADWFGRRHVFRDILSNGSKVAPISLISPAIEAVAIDIDEKYQKYLPKIAGRQSDIYRIYQVIEKRSYFENKTDILLWLQDEKLGNYFLDKLPKEFDDLSKIDFLLEELIKAHNPFVAIDILEESISEKNNKCIFQFLDKYIKFLLEKDNDTFGNHAAEIVKKILEKHPEESGSSFAFVQKFIRVHPDNFEDMRTMREFGKQMISDIISNLFEIWKREKKNENIDKLIKLVGKKFNLIDDDYKFSMFTPEKLFLMLYEYVISDFENNFKKVVEMAVNQFKDKRIGYGKEYDGKEWSASGISRSGKFYSITDRHIVEKVLAPAAKHFYENAEDKDVAWEKIKELCFVPEKEISPEKPDLLNRAIIPIALERYEKLKSEKKKSALKILESLIDMTSLPDKGHIIFQEVARSSMSDADKWRIVEVSLNAKWNKKKLPADVFVEQIVSELAKRGDKREEAKTLLEKWSKDEEYLKRQGFGEYDLLGVISGLLAEKDKSEGIKLFEEYVYSSAFKGKLERFDAFDVAGKLALILDSNCKKGIEILWKIYRQDKLTENEQILICSGINKISKPDIRIKVYKEFLKKILDDLDADIDKIVAKFDKDYPRTAIVEFGDELAKEKKFEEALNIAKIFINDPDPRVDDKEDNLHEQIKKGEEESSITSVRGWVCWLFHQFPILEGRDYIPETIPLIQKLSKDPNYYVRSQTCFPLAELMRVRNSVIPGSDKDKKEWFLNRDDARKVENIAFDMLRCEENQKLKAVMINLAYVFNYMRSMDTSQAVEILNIFKNSEFTEPLEKIASSYIFYAEFRKNAFEGKLWEDLDPFDDKPIKELLIDFLKNGKSESRRTFLWQFIGLIGESKNSPHFSYDDAFSIAYKYIKIISEKYDPEIFTHIFMFIKENMEKKYEDCGVLFMSCLKKEQEALRSEKIDKTWLPFYYHRDILEEIFKKGEKETFLVAFEIIAGYSPKYSHWDELKSAANHLIEYSKDNKKVGKIFDKLIENNPAYYDIKVKWEKR